MKTKRFLSLLGKILGTVLTVVLAVMLVLNIYVAAARNIFGKNNPTVFGFSSAAVVTGSMSPAINAGDFIVTKRCTSYEIGDIITFEGSSAATTHRIVKKIDGGFITKGDANDTADGETVPESSIVGKVVLTVGGAGNIIIAAKSPLGMLCILAVLIAFIYIPELIKKKRRS